jgi:hypothetical protein
MLFKKKKRPVSFINLYEKPTQPEGWVMEKHLFRPEVWFTKLCFFRYLEFDASKISYFISITQTKGYSVEGIWLVRILTRRFLFNANVLEHLLKNQKLIPKDWFGYYIVFLGTVYKNSYGKKFVRYMYNDGHQWLEDYLSLDGEKRFSYKHKVPYLGILSMWKSIKF